jgi:hypothetical protein
MILVGLLIQVPGDAQRVLPEWKQGSIGLYGTWKQASFIVVGKLDGGKLVGETDPPSYATEAVRKIYWCEGELRIDAYIRGNRVPTNKYLWGSLQPECRPDQLPAGHNPYVGPVMRIWFLKIEDEYLRPILEGGGVHLLILRGQWPSNPRENPERYLARLLLTPYVDSLNAEDYALHFFQNASNACFILGSEDCKLEIRKLSLNPNSIIRNAACKYLRSQFDESCSKVARSPA